MTRMIPKTRQTKTAGKFTLVEMMNHDNIRRNVTVALCSTFSEEDYGDKINRRIALYTVTVAFSLSHTICRTRPRLTSKQRRN